MGALEKQGGGLSDALALWHGNRMKLLSWIPEHPPWCSAFKGITREIKGLISCPAWSALPQGTLVSLYPGLALPPGLTSLQWMLGSCTQTGLDVGGHRWKKDSGSPFPLFKKKMLITTLAGWQSITVFAKQCYFQKLTLVLITDYSNLRTFGEKVFVCFKLSLSLVNWDMSGLVWWDGERERVSAGEWRLRV